VGENEQSEQPSVGYPALEDSDMPIYHLGRSRRVVGNGTENPSHIVTDVIINHVDADLALADLLTSKLEALGWQVLSNRQLPVGRRLEEYLEAALPSVRCVVTIWSETSVSSSLVRDVANEALRMGITVPVLSQPIDIPLGHRSIKTIDITSNDLESVDRVIDAVTQTIEFGPAEPLVMDEVHDASLSIRIARRVVEQLNEKASVTPLQKEVSNELPLKFNVGSWSVDVGTNSLSNGNLVRRIQPRAMEVLVYLVSRSPTTVGIGEILDTVWKDRVVVDSAVHRCVRELRIALDDDVRNARYIETIARRGYRIIAEITLDQQSRIRQP